MKAEKSYAVSEVKHRHGNSVESLQCARVDKLIIYVTMHKQKAPIYKLSRSKVPTTQKIQAYRHTRKNSGSFYGTAKAPTLASAIICLLRFLCQSSCFCSIYNLLVSLQLTALSRHVFLRASLTGWIATPHLRALQLCRKEISANL